MYFQSVLATLEPQDYVVVEILGREISRWSTGLLVRFFIF